MLLLLIKLTSKLSDARKQTNQQKVKKYKQNVSPEHDSKIHK